MDLKDTVHLVAAADYLDHFPSSLPAEFTAKEFSKHTRLRGYALYDAISVYEALGALERVGKQGRATLFAGKI